MHVVMHVHEVLLHVLLLFMVVYVRTNIFVFYFTRCVRTDIDIYVSVFVFQTDNLSLTEKVFVLPDMLGNYSPT